MPDESIWDEIGQRFGPNEATKPEWMSDTRDPWIEDKADVQIEESPPRLKTYAARRTYSAPVPDDHHIHHICGNRWCRNPDHLIAVSPEDHHKLHRKESFCA